MAVLTLEAQIGAAAVLLYMEELLMASAKRDFSKEELLVLFRMVKDDPDFFDPGLVDTVENVD